MQQKKFGQLVYGLLIIILTLLFLFYPNGVSTVILIFCLAIFYYFFYQSVKKPISVSKIETFFTIDLLFLLFYYIIYYYPYQLYLLNMFDLDKKVGSYNTYTEYSNKAVLAATIGLLAFMKGYKTLSSFKRSKKNLNINPKILSRLFLLLIVFILIAFFLAGGLQLFVGVYAGSDIGDITGNAIFSLVNYFMVLGVLQVIYYYYKLRRITLTNYLIIIISATWSFALLYLGDRNSFFLIAIAAAGGISTYIRGFSRTQIVIFAGMALFLYTLVEVTRTSQDKTDISALWQAYLDKQENNSDANSLNSFNITTTGVRATFAAVPRKRDFFYGKFKVVSFTTLIPYSSRLFFSKDDPYLGSSDVIKEEMITSKATWGTGTNIISDSYLDFGILGVIFIMYGLGYYAGKVKNTCVKYPENIQYFFLYILILTYYSEISRYGLDFILRAVIWTSLLFGLLKLKKSI